MTDQNYPGPPPADLSPEQLRAATDWAIISRRSVRAFLPDPVSRAVIERILAVASRAPSGTNTQPWQVTVLTGAARQRLADALLAAYDNPAVAATHTPEYVYYPRQWVPPYLDRRRKLGWDLYGLFDIGKRDKEKMHLQHGRNFRFFDAPVGIIFTIDRILEQGSWMDYGMFLQNIMVAARGHGLDTCVQAAFMHFHRIIADQLLLPESQMLVCGMSLGYADESKVENSLQTERVPVREFARFID